MALATRSFSRFLIAVGVVCVVLAATHSWWLGASGRALVENAPPVRADIVVVLAGDYFGHRIVKGAELVRDGYAPEVLVSGPPGFYGGHECDYAIPFAVKKGFPASYFKAFPHDALSTEAEARAVVAELRHRGLHRYLLVTGNFHTARSARLFRAAAPELEFRTVAAPDEYFEPDSWWRNREGRKRWLVEWEKTFASMLGL